MDSFKKQLWISLGIIITSIVVALIVVYLFISDISSKTSQVLLYRSGIALESANLGNAAQLKKDAAQAALYQTAIQKLLPNQDGLINFPQMVDSIARSYNLNDQVSFTNDSIAPSPSAVGSIGFSIEVDGKASDCVAFLQNIELKSDQFVIRVDNFEFSGGDAKSRLVVGGKVFFQ
jgi:hypothetical protein